MTKEEFWAVTECNDWRLIVLTCGERLRGLTTQAPVPFDRFEFRYLSDDDDADIRYISYVNVDWVV